MAPALKETDRAEFGAEGGVVHGSRAEKDQEESHKEISSQGRTTEESERAKTEEERAEEERLAAIQKEEDAKKI